MISVCCAINIYQVNKEVASKNSSYYFAICAISSVFLYMITLIWYLFKKFGSLDSQPIKNRGGAAYTHLAVSKAGRSVLAFLLL